MSADPVKNVMAEVSTTLELMDRIDRTGVIGDIRFPTVIWNRHRAAMPMVLPPDQVMSITMFYQTIISINQILDGDSHGLRTDQPLPDSVRAQIQFIRRIGEQMALGSLTGGGPRR